jgi:hypothetical protein
MGLASGASCPACLRRPGTGCCGCGAGPTPLAACLLLRQGSSPLPDRAELLVFACPLNLPLPGRSYRGIHLLRAYRAHPDFGRLPMVLVAVAPRRCSAIQIPPATRSPRARVTPPAAR